MLTGDIGAVCTIFMTDIMTDYFYNKHFLLYFEYVFYAKNKTFEDDIYIRSEVLNLYRMIIQNLEQILFIIQT